MDQNFKNLIKRGQLKATDMFGALFTLRIQYKFSQTRCEDGARGVLVN